MCYWADLEMTSEVVFRKIVDINLFGAVRITKSLLPLIRKAKGRIVNVSSLLGKLFIRPDICKLFDYKLVLIAQVVEHLFPEREVAVKNGTSGYLACMKHYKASTGSSLTHC